MADGAVNMHRRFHTCIYECFTMVTKGVVHSGYKVVIRLPFGVIQRHKMSQGIGCFGMSSSDDYQR